MPTKERRRTNLDFRQEPLKIRKRIAPSRLSAFVASSGSDECCGGEASRSVTAQFTTCTQPTKAKSDALSPKADPFDRENGMNSGPLSLP